VRLLPSWELGVSVDGGAGEEIERFALLIRSKTTELLSRRRELLLVGRTVGRCGGEPGLPEEAHVFVEVVR
jgi:hypothetical protein